MIYCHKCKAQNISSATLCGKCGTNLLPGAKIGERIGCLVLGIVSGIISAALAYAIVFIIKPPWLGMGQTVAVLLIGAFIALLLIIMGIFYAIKKTPMYERYLRRAIRHVELYPKQSIEDYSMALELLPAKSIQNRIEILNERASIFNKLSMINEAKHDWQESLGVISKLINSQNKNNKGKSLLKRAAIYEKLGMKDESILDKLNYTYIEEQLLPPENTIAMGIIEGFNKGIAESKRQDLIKLRTELMGDGRFKAVGYCPKCRTLVNLDFRLKCSVSPKHPKSTDVHFTV